MSIEFEFEELPREHEVLGSREKPLKISDLTSLIKAQLETQFAEVVLIGEISNFKAHPSGHFYFVLKDESSTINAVMFRGANSVLKFDPQNGQKVIAVGRISVYPPRGSYQIVLSRMEPDGFGSLQLAFEQLKARLEKEGLFDAARKRKLPRFPKKIGLVTSSSGAAVRDILNVLQRRFSSLEICIYSVKVQGDGAAQEVACAIRDFNRCFSDTDVLIVGRGGGSLEDLWPFNEEVVARAIFESKIPIISAVGHEIDFTIADFVADVRAPTPSAAAELVVADKLETLRHLQHLCNRLQQFVRRFEFLGMRSDDLRQRLVQALQNKLARLEIRIRKLQGQFAHHQPQLILQRAAHRFQKLESLLDQNILERVRVYRDRTREQKMRLELLNPRTIMERGYSIVRLEKNSRVVRKASEIQMGDSLLIEFHKGSIRAKV